MLDFFLCLCDGLIKCRDGGIEEDLNVCSGVVELVLHVVFCRLDRILEVLDLGPYIIVCHCIVEATNGKLLVLNLFLEGLDNIIFRLHSAG